MHCRSASLNEKAFVKSESRTLRLLRTQKGQLSLVGLADEDFDSPPESELAVPAALDSALSFAGASLGFGLPLFSLLPLSVRLSVTYQPLPLNITLAGWNTLRTAPLHSGQFVTGGSLNRCCRSKLWLQSSHAYSYNGIEDTYLRSQVLRSSYSSGETSSRLPLVRHKIAAPALHIRASTAVGANNLVRSTQLRSSKGKRSPG